MLDLSFWREVEDATLHDDPAWLMAEQRNPPILANAPRLRANTQRPNVRLGFVPVTVGVGPVGRQLLAGVDGRAIRLRAKIGRDRFVGRQPSQSRIGNTVLRRPARLVPFAALLEQG